MKEERQVDKTPLQRAAEKHSYNITQHKSGKVILPYPLYTSELNDAFMAGPTGYCPLKFFSYQSLSPTEPYKSVTS